MTVHPEIERFAKEVASNASFREELKKVGTEQTAVVRFANGKGYKFTMDDVKALQPVGELTDDDLSKVVGGLVFLFGSSSGYICTTYHKALLW